MSVNEKMLTLLREIHQRAIEAGWLMHGDADADLFSRVGDLLDEVEREQERA